MSWTVDCGFVELEGTFALQIDIALDCFLGQADLDQFAGLEGWVLRWWWSCLFELCGVAQWYGRRVCTSKALGCETLDVPDVAFGNAVRVEVLQAVEAEDVGAGLEAVASSPLLGF